MHSRNKYSEKLDLYALKPLIKVLTGMRRVGKSTLLKCHGESLRKKYPSAVILEIDKESMEWDHIRTGKELHEFAVASFQGKLGPYVLMVDEVQDIDGLLCPDPSIEENDDGPAYLDFLRNAPALYSCRYKIKHLVTSRLEKYRLTTEDWLARKGIEFENLHMVDLPTAKARSQKGPQFHALQKAEVYKSLSETRLFLESAKWQAELIAKYSGKPALSMENGLFYHPDKKSIRNAQIEYYRKYPRALAGLIVKRLAAKIQKAR